MTKLDFGRASARHHRELHRRIRELEAELAEAKKALLDRDFNGTLIITERDRAEKAEAEVEQLKAANLRLVNDFEQIAQALLWFKGGGRESGDTLSGPKTSVKAPSHTDVAAANPAAFDDAVWCDGHGRYEHAEVPCAAREEAKT